jgi:hypothetical protein
MNNEISGPIFGLSFSYPGNCRICSTLNIDLIQSRKRNITSFLKYKSYQTQTIINNLNCYFLIAFYYGIWESINLRKN